MNSKGVTMVELMMVVAIMGITAVLVAPALGNLVQRNKVEATADEMVRIFKTARSEAIKRGGPVEITVIPNLVEADNEFGEGVRVWVDLDSDGNFDAPGELLMEFTPPDSMTIDASQNFTAMRYLPTGRVGTVNGNSTFFLEVCANGDASGTRLELARNYSRIRVADYSGCPT
ncbi:MAG: prepilin-type N-terminal cleavage/methylation domain-containing protein [Gammaproteobacteria bacterium]|nr:prepilin-type N-terminal cleavage/methylation domain-containing protein [Gammaproteobacteria bacterium]